MSGQLTCRRGSIALGRYRKEGEQSALVSCIRRPAAWCGRRGFISVPECQTESKSHPFHLLGHESTIITCWELQRVAFDHLKEVCAGCVRHEWKPVHQITGDFHHLIIAGAAGHAQMGLRVGAVAAQENGELRWHRTNRHCKRLCEPDGALVVVTHAHGKTESAVG